MRESNPEGRAVLTAADRRDLDAILDASDDLRELVWDAQSEPGAVDVGPLMAPIREAAARLRRIKRRRAKRREARERRGSILMD